MHWLTLHLLRERQVQLILAPLLFSVYGMILMFIWQNGMNFYTCLIFTVGYMVIDYLATMHRYRFFLATMPISATIIRQINFQYIGLMFMIYSIVFTAFFLLSEWFYQALSMQDLLVTMLLGLIMALFIMNILLLMDVSFRSSLAGVFNVFLFFIVLAMPNPTKIVHILAIVQWWHVLCFLFIVGLITYGVWRLYPNRLRLKDVEG